MKTEIMKKLEIFTVVTGDVAITVKVDYDSGKISLVDNSYSGKYANKNWVFAEREKEYMNGWRNILKGMENAITEAEKRLEIAKEEKEERITKLLIKAEMEMAKEKNKTKK